MLSGSAEETCEWFTRHSERSSAKKDPWTFQQASLVVENWLLACHRFNSTFSVSDFRSCFATPRVRLSELKNFGPAQRTTAKGILENIEQGIANLRYARFIRPHQPTYVRSARTSVLGSAPSRSKALDYLLVKRSIFHDDLPTAGRPLHQHFYFGPRAE
jgi:hypothetical protein